MSYVGPERRIHAVVSTKNREYHVRAGICIAVRDKKTGVWISSHEVVGMMLEECEPLTRFLGHPLHFLSDEFRVRTSQVENIFRPGRSVVDVYSLIWSVSPRKSDPETKPL